MNKQKRQQVQFWFLILCFFSAIAGTFLFHHSYKTVTNSPAIVDGTLTLSGTYPRTIYLDGDWEFFWDELILSDPASDSKSLLSPLPSRLPGLSRQYHAEGI
ncbi:MAG: hypothetical protein J6I64_06675, partial [Lachnospiraceae bacterium]|nr:hypothetical protein [Lachnospiraceae bacterium]